MYSISALLEVLRDPTFALIFTMIAKTFTHILMLTIIFNWMDIKVLRSTTIICGLCGMILEILPIVITNMIIPDPLVARVWVYRFFVYSNPLHCLLYYIIIRRGLNLSPTRAVIIMHYQILLNYTITIVFLFLNDFFCRVFAIGATADTFFPPDYCSFLLILGVWFSLWYAINAFLRKSKRHLIIPPNYADKKNRRTSAKVFLTVSFIYGVTVFFRINWISSVSNPITFTTAMIYILLFSGTLFYLLNSTAQLRNRLLEWEMQATGTYISSLLHINQEFRTIKQDFYHVLQGYGDYLSIKDYDGLEKYHQRLFNTTKQAGDFLSIIEVLRSRIAVYSLLETMSRKAKKAGVLFSINLICEVTDIILDDIDLCRVLGIVIDNAIEEAELSADKQVNLSFERKDENTIVLVISNTTKGDVDTKQIFQEGYTTKTNHTGIGLSQVMHILNTYEHCSIRVNYHDNQFTIFLILNSDRRTRS